MSEQARQYRLHVANRLEELRARHGRELEDQPLPDWLDLMPESSKSPQAGPQTPPANGTPQQPPRQPQATPHAPRVQADGAVVRVEVD